MLLAPKFNRQPVQRPYQLCYGLVLWCCMLTPYTKGLWVEAVTRVPKLLCFDISTLKHVFRFLKTSASKEDHMHALQMLLCKAHLLSSRTERAATAIVLARRQSRRVLQSGRAAKTSAGVNSNPSASKPRGMKLKGSCHCGAVSFEVESKTPQPFMHCYCTICRKTQGGGGYTINIMVCVCAESGEGHLLYECFYLVACMPRHRHCQRIEQSPSFLFDNTDRCR